MKISEFAQKYGVGISTVRYYVNCNLLLPKIQNTQFRFDGHCAKDMEAIMLFKRFGFSIGEIQSMLGIMRLSNLTAADDVLDLVQLLEKRDAVLREELHESETILQELEHTIDSLKASCSSRDAARTAKGVPIEMLSLLCCPDCHETLSLQNADIQNGQVLRADVVCSCGYTAAIQNGILVTSGGDISELDSPDVDRKFYKDLPVSWVTLFQQAFNWMLAQYSGMDLSGKVIMENHINCYFFLFARLSELKPDAYYIFTDKYPEVVALFKQLIERQNTNLKILYIADSTFRYPLRQNAVDLYVDFCSLNEYAIFNRGKDLLSVMRPYLKPDFNMLGTYFYFKPRSPSQQKLLREYPCCVPENYQYAHFRSIMNENNMARVCEEEIGQVDEWGGRNRNFTFHVAEDPMRLLSYRYRLDSGRKDNG